MFSRCHDKRRTRVHDTEIVAEAIDTSKEITIPTQTISAIHATLKNRVELGISPNFTIETDGIRIKNQDSTVYYTTSEGTLVLPLKYILAKRNLNMLIHLVDSYNTQKIKYEVTKLSETVKIMVRDKETNTLLARGEFDTELVIAGAFDFFPSFKIETEHTMEASTLVRGLPSKYVMFSSFDYRKHPSLISRVLVPRQELFNALRVRNPKGNYSSKIIVVNDYGL